MGSNSDTHIQQAEHLVWRLFRVSDQKLLKWFRNLAIYSSSVCMYTGPNPNQLFTNNIKLTLHYHKSWISYLLSIVNPTNMQWMVAIFKVFENDHRCLFHKFFSITLIISGMEIFFLNGPGAHLGDFQYYKGRKCMLRDSRELIGCCMKTIDAGMEVGMAWFKCKPSSNIWQDFPNHLMSLWSETRKRRQSKFSALMSLAETTATT